MTSLHHKNRLKQETGHLTWNVEQLNNIIGSDENHLTWMDMMDKIIIATINVYVKRFSQNYTLVVSQ